MMQLPTAFGAARAAIQMGFQEYKPSHRGLLFDRIYTIAKSTETQSILPELKKILTQDTCLDVRDSQGNTVAGKLAAEGNQAAVKELMKLGANINLIAYGAALGGHREYAEWLRHHYGADASWIAQGAARGGDREYSEWLRQHHRANVSWIAMGAAQGGHQDYAEWLRQHHEANINLIANGAAQGGYQDYAEWLRQHHHANVNWIALGAARGGHQEYAEWLRQHHNANALYVARGAAHGGHRGYVEWWLRQRIANSALLIAEDAAQGGFQDYLEFLHLNCDPNVPERIAPILNWHRHLGTEKLALRYLAFIQNDRHRVALSRALNDSTPPLPYNILRLLPRARQIQATMQRYGLHYDQALAWTNPEIQSLFLYSSHLTQSKHLPEDLILSLSLQLAPLTLADAEGLLAVAKLIRARALLTAELKRYYNRSGTYFFSLLGRNSRAYYLAERCAKANDLKTLTLLLDNEIKVPAISEGDKKYQDFLSQQRATLSSRLLIKFGESEAATAQGTEAKPMSSQSISETTTSSVRANVTSSSSSHLPSL
jgi:adenosyl cobinamide kinase/adenosyl cobinamide phosphate guanylyltransferase